jgi:purine-binding chemotaxis protein CheW
MATEELSQWVTFSLDNEIFGINVMQIQEVLRYTEIAPVPGATHYILGIINLRGNVVTVVDGRRKLNLPEVENIKSSRIIIIEVENQVLGLLADSVSEVIEINDEKIEVVDNDEYDPQSYIHGVCQVDENLLILMDVKSLFKQELNNQDDTAGSLGF